MKTLKLLGTLVAIGFVTGTGMRIAERLIPKPETRVIVCALNDVDKPICKPLVELMKMSSKP